jgi:hypothetical protein
LSKKDIFLYYKQKAVLKKSQKTEILKVGLKEKKAKSISRYVYNEWQHSQYKIKKGTKKITKIFVSKDNYNNGLADKKFYIAGRADLNTKHSSIYGLAGTKEVKNLSTSRKKWETSGFNIDKLRNEMLQKSKPKLSTINNKNAGTSSPRYDFSGNKNKVNLKGQKILTMALNRRFYAPNKDDGDNNAELSAMKAKEVYDGYRFSGRAVGRAINFSSKLTNIIGNLISLAVKTVTAKFIFALVPILIIIILAAAALFIPLGMLPMNLVMAEGGYRDKVISETLKAYSGFISGVENSIGSVDDLKVLGDANVDYRYILCLLAVKNNQRFDEKAISEISRIYGTFAYAATKEESYTEVRQVTHIDEAGNVTYDEEEIIKTRVIISYGTKSVLEVADELGFDDVQIEWLKMLLSNEFGAGTQMKTTGLTDEELNEVYKLIDGITDPNRRKLIDTAMSLWGRTSYLWGGKAEAGGYPSLLDCSGYTGWAYSTALNNNNLNGGTASQFYVGESVSSYELQAGDLAFWKMPSQVENTPNDANHVGLYICTLENGKPVYIHCQGGTGVTINSFSFQYFKTIMG